MDVRKRAFETRFLEIAQCERGETCAEPRHAFAVALCGDPGGVGVVFVFAPPAEAGFAVDGALVAVNAPEDGADDVIFGEEDVDEGVALPAEFVGGEDGDGDDADRVGGFRGHGGFVDELGNDGFGEDVEEVDEEGGAFGVGDGGWRRWGGEELGDFDSRFGYGYCFF